MFYDFVDSVNVRFSVSDKSGCDHSIIQNLSNQHTCYFLIFSSHFVKVHHYLMIRVYFKGEIFIHLALLKIIFHFTFSLSSIPITYLIPEESCPTKIAGESASLLESYTLLTVGESSFYEMFIFEK